MIVGHHPNLLRLLQHLIYFVGRAIEHNMFLCRIFNLFQQRPDNKMQGNKAHTK